MGFCLCFGAIVVSLVTQAQGSSSWSQFFPLMTEWPEHSLTVFKMCLYFQPFLIWYLEAVAWPSGCVLFSPAASGFSLCALCFLKNLMTSRVPFLCVPVPALLTCFCVPLFCFFLPQIFEQILAVFLWLT